MNEKILCIENKIKIINENDRIITFNNLQTTNIDNKNVVYRLVEINTNSANAIITYDMYKLYYGVLKEKKDKKWVIIEMDEDLKNKILDVDSRANFYVNKEIKISNPEI
ncbi:MAG: hypothetical protein ACP5RQ_02395 [Candidatus Micrarchaeia archaeon]